jgi:predicted NBD/HSP70 family sugar kinase
MRHGASGAALRDVNRSAVLRLIGRHGPMSRAELARRLGVRPGTVTAQARGLINSGIVTPVDMQSSSGGRPAELLALVGSAAVAIGAKVAEDHVAIVLADLDGTVLANETVPFDAIGSNPFVTLATLLAPHVRAANASHVLLGVGVGIPGFEDPYGSGVVQAPLLGWPHLPLGEHLSRQLGVPVLVDNDVNTLAVAESLYGVGRGFEDFLTVTIGRGVGMGIVIAGELYRGARGAAGEFGHVCIDRDGESCSCGKRGCLETVVSDPALLAAARRRRVVDKAAGPADLAAKAAAGHKAALEIYREAGAALGRALAAAVVVLNPQAVVVGGEGTRAWPYMAEAFHDAFEGEVFPPTRGATAVLVERWDDGRWALGAASLVLRAPFVTPMHPHPIIERIRGLLDAGFQTPAAAASSEFGDLPWSG